MGSPLPSVAIILVAAILLWQFPRDTSIGLHIYATGDNPHAARVTGVSLWASYAWAFGLGGLFSGLAGIVLSAQTSSVDPHIDDPFTLSSIAAAVVGGVSFFGGDGKVVGSIAGAVVIGILVSLLVFQGVSSFWQGVVEGVILVIVVAITTWRRGAGLSGLATRARGVAQLQTEETP